MRVSGLTSGMDTDTLVKQMMTAARAPLDKLSQQKQTLEWKRDSYRTINSQLVDFRNNKLNKYRISTEVNAYKSEVTGDTAAISVKASPTASQVPMTITVASVATQRSLESSETLGAGITKNSKLSELGASGTFTLSVKSSATASPKEITFSNTDSIDSVIKKINADTSINATASFDEASGKITLKSKEYGNSDFSFSGSLTDAFKMSTSVATGGKKADVTINGKQMELNTNTLRMNGVDITILAKTETDKPAIVNTKVDSTKMVETIKSFISDYNSVLNTLNSKLSEERYRDFAPLTDEQKKDMKEDDVTRWEAKAKSGLLKGDEILNQTVANLRNSVVFAKSTSGITLSSIGITTGQWFEGGALSISDEAKLTKAIEENPDEVMELFTGSADGTATKGLFNEMYDKVNITLGQMASRAGTSKYSTDVGVSFNEDSNMGKELSDLKSRMSAMTKKLTDLETRYYSQFTAMEQAINKMNSQSSSLASFAGQ
jgi:flagellar hook-associated protein 2